MLATAAERPGRGLGGGGGPGVDELPAADEAVRHMQNGEEELQGLGRRLQPSRLLQPAELHEPLDARGAALALVQPGQKGEELLVGHQRAVPAAADGDAAVSQQPQGGAHKHAAVSYMLNQPMQPMQL